MCDCCGFVTDQLWRNEALLGTRDALCNLCFAGWYERAITDPDKLAANSNRIRSARNEQAK